jgi:hypothetical protein
MYTHKICLGADAANQFSSPNLTWSPVFFVFWWWFEREGGNKSETNLINKFVRSSIPQHSADTASGPVQEMIQKIELRRSVSKYCYFSITCDDDNIWCIKHNIYIRYDLVHCTVCI